MRLTFVVLFVCAACSPAPMTVVDAGTDGGMVRPPRPALSVATGDTHACARMADGAVRCWGSYQNPSLMPLTTDDHPVAITGVSQTQGLALGLDLSCAWLEDAGVSCWGSGDAGQLGNGALLDSDTPVDVTGLDSGVVELSAGDRHVCARLYDGTVACWGDNSQGQLGDGKPAKLESTPSNLGAQGITQLDLGQQHSCALRVSGTVICWGDNSISQLGDGTMATRNTAVPVVGAGTGSQVSAGTNSCLLADDKSLTCWGTLANFPGTNPTTVPGFANVAQVSVGDGHVCARLNDSTVACSGDNTFGQLGDGTMTSRTDGGVVPGLGERHAGCTAGDGYSCAVISDGGVQCWGKNTSGQLGDGTRDNRPTPAPVQF